jgi:hypothetical protein
MKRRVPGLLALPLLCAGFGGLSRFSGHVRTVEAVGLSGSGFSLGVGFALLVFGFAGAFKGTKKDTARFEAGNDQERQKR